MTCARCHQAQGLEYEMAEAIPEYNITGLACCNFHTCIIILDQTIVCSAGTIGLVERGTSRHVDENGPHCGAGESFALPGNSGLWRSGVSSCRKGPPPAWPFGSRRLSAKRIEPASCAEAKRERYIRRRGPSRPSRVVHHKRNPTAGNRAPQSSPRRPPFHVTASSLHTHTHVLSRIHSLWINPSLFDCMRARAESPLRYPQGVRSHLLVHAGVARTWVAVSRQFGANKRLWRIAISTACCRFSALISFIARASARCSAPQALSACATRSY
jgi:hypothetical protein